MPENADPTLPPPKRTTTAEAAAVAVPDRPALEGLEAKWGRRWQEDGIYSFDRTKTREQIY
jgi:valyl-tRNA synthetase